MRDWRDLQEGSFKGLRFLVESESVSGGRAVAVHEYVRAERHDAEDMGRKAAKASVTAYVASDSVDAEATQIFRACASPGAGMLRLPYGRSAMAICSSVKRSSAKDKLGLIAFDLEFVTTGAGGQPSVSRLFDLQAAASAAALAGHVAASLAGIALAPVRFALALLGAYTPAAMAVIGAAAAGAALARVFESAVARVSVEPDPVARAAIAVALCRDLSAAGAADPATWIGAAEAIASLPAPTLSDPGMGASLQASTVSRILHDAPTLSPARNEALALARAAAALMAAACWQEAAVAAAADPPRTRDAARELRARIVAGVQPVLDHLAAARAMEAHEAVRATVALAVEGMDAAMLDIAPLALIDARRRLPSSVAAWLLYGDPERAAELVERAAVATPMMMPAKFLALAPTAAA